MATIIGRMMIAGMMPIICCTKGGQVAARVVTIMAIMVGATAGIRAATAAATAALIRQGSTAAIVIIETITHSNNTTIMVAIMVINAMFVAWAIVIAINRSISGRNVDVTNRAT